MSSPTLRCLLAVSCFLVLAACGGGGGGGGDGGDQDAPLPLYATGPLRATVQFPPDNALGQCGQITVRGTAGGAGIAAVSVNGVPATGFGEFGEWVARVPLACGANVLRVDVHDEDGGRLVGADSVRLDVLEEFLYVPGAIGAGTEPDAVYCVDSVVGDVIAVDFFQGTRKRLGFQPHHTGGALMVDDGGRDVFLQYGFQLAHYRAGEGGSILIRSLENEGESSSLVVASDVDHDRFFAVINERVYEYSTLTGHRTLLSSVFPAEAKGTGPAPYASDGAAYDPDSHALYCANDHQVVRVDLATGDRTLFTTNAAEPGEFVAGIAWDADGQLIVYANRPTGPSRYTGVIYGIGYISGGRDLVSGPGQGSGVDLPTVNRETHITLEHGRDRMFVSDTLNCHVVAVDLATGDRTVVVHHQVGAGPPLLVPTDAALDRNTGRLFVTNSLDDWLLSVDLGTGNRSLLSGRSRGSGPELLTPNGLVLDLPGSAAYVVDPNQDVLARIDLGTGDRTIVSDAATGGGPVFLCPVDLARGPLPGRLYLADRLLGHPTLKGAILEVDVATGDRTTVSDGLLSLQIPWLEITGMAYDSSRNRFLTSDREQRFVSATDPDTGSRSLVSENRSPGIGPPFEQPDSLDVDENRGRALVGDWSLRGVYSVDLAGGDRLVIYDEGHGRGPITPSPRAAIPGLHPGQVIVVDTFTNLIVVVDEASGDRVIVSR